MIDVWNRGEPLSNVDSAWLRMEEPTNLMTITALLTFDAPIDMGRLKTRIEDRLLPYDRFRQRVAMPTVPLLGRPRWVDDDHFALAAHLKRTALPYPGDQGTLQELLSELMSTPLDPTKPLWQLHVVENYGPGCALVARLHHCIADGIALVRVLFSLMDASPDGQPAEAGVQPPSPPVTRPGLPRSGDPLDSFFTASRALLLARYGAGAATELGRLVTMPPDPVTVFKGRLGVLKRAAWSWPIPLDEVKAAARRLDATVNDLLLAAVSGALRRYMIDHGDEPDGLTVRAVVPVNLRPGDDTEVLGNRFGLVFLCLPVGVATPHERVVALKREMDELKASPQAVVAFSVLNAMGRASPEVERIGVSMFARKATAVMTNVPGPAQTLYLAGQPIRELLFWVPQSGRLGLGVSILSYAGTVRIGLASDAGLVPQPGVIVDHLDDELGALGVPRRDRPDA